MRPPKKKRARNPTLFRRNLGFWPPPTRANTLQLNTISTIPTPLSSKSLQIYSLNGYEMKTRKPFSIPHAKQLESCREHAHRFSFAPPPPLLDMYTNELIFFTGIWSVIGGKWKQVNPNYQGGCSSLSCLFFIPDWSWTRPGRVLFSSTHLLSLSLTSWLPGGEGLRCQFCFFN